MDANTDFHDSYRILKPRSIYFYNCPELTKLMHKTSTYQTWDSSIGRFSWMAYNVGMKQALNLMHATLSQVTIKMLDVYRDGKEHNYREVCKVMGLAYGHDIDCWRSLDSRGMIEFTSKHERGLKFYTITPLGKEVLEIADANQAYMRIARWFKLENKGKDITIEMMNADLKGENAWQDLMPEAVNAMLEGLFNPSSRMHQIGSAYRWMNNIAYLTKRSVRFVETLSAPETMAWLRGHMNKYSGIAKFLGMLKKSQKKFLNHVKAA